MKLILLNLLLLTSIAFYAQTDEDNLVMSYQDSVFTFEMDSTIFDVSLSDSNFFALDSNIFIGSLTLDVSHYDLNKVKRIYFDIYDMSEKLIFSTEIENITTNNSISAVFPPQVIPRNIKLSVGFLLVNDRIPSVKTKITSLNYE